MNVGSVNISGDPIVRVAVKTPGRKGEEREIEAVLDTGFSGFLALPSALIEEMELEQTGREEFVTASGAKYFPGKYEAPVAFGGREQMAEIVEAAEPLVGAALLDGHEVCISYVEDGSVRIEVLS